MYKVKTVLTLALVSFLIIGCKAKKNDTGDSTKIDNYALDALETLDVSYAVMDTVKESISIASAAKKSAIPESSKGMVTGRIITGRAPRVKPSVGNNGVNNNLYCPISPSPRIAAKEDRQSENGEEAHIFPCSCSEKYFGDGSGGCSSCDCDLDGVQDFVSIWQGDATQHSVIEIESVFQGEGKYLMITFCSDNGCNQYMSSQQVGNGNCKLFSCEKINAFTDGINYAKSLSSDCSLNMIGFYNIGGQGKSCMEADFTGDGETDIVISEWDNENNWVISFIGEEDGKAEKTECREDSCVYYYAQNCKVSSQCEIPNCDWKKGGEINSIGNTDLACIDADISGDGKTEKIISLLPEDSSENATILIEGEDGFSAYSHCSISSDGEKVNCVVKSGKCSIDSCPSNPESVESYIKSNCSLQDYGSCESVEDCEAMVYAVIQHTPEDEKSGDENSCSKIIDAKTGEFIKIRKVEDGYEYKKGSTESSFSALCPLDSTKVDFKNCSIISGCEADKSAEIATKILDFVEESTKQVFSLSISDSKKGIGGTIQVEYYRKSGDIKINGKIKVKDGNVDLDGYIKGDGSMSLIFNFVTTDGKEIKCKFALKKDGSGEGKIESSDGKKYTVKLNADGTGKICNDSGKCWDV